MAAGRGGGGGGAGRERVPPARGRDIHTRLVLPPAVHSLASPVCGY